MNLAPQRDTKDVKKMDLKNLDDQETVLSELALPMEEVEYMLDYIAELLWKCKLNEAKAELDKLHWSFHPLVASVWSEYHLMRSLLAPDTASFQEALRVCDDAIKHVGALQKASTTTLRSMECTSIISEQLAAKSICRFLLGDRVLALSAVRDSWNTAHALWELAAEKQPGIVEEELKPAGSSGGDGGIQEQEDHTIGAVVAALRGTGGSGDNSPNVNGGWTSSGAAAVYQHYIKAHVAQKMHFIMGAFMILGAMLPRDAWWLKLIAKGDLGDSKLTTDQIRENGTTFLWRCLNSEGTRTPVAAILLLVQATERVIVTRTKKASADQAALMKLCSTEYPQSPIFLWTVSHGNLHSGDLKSAVSFGDRSLKRMAAVAPTLFGKASLLRSYCAMLDMLQLRFRSACNHYTAVVAHRQTLASLRCSAVVGLAACWSAVAKERHDNFVSSSHRSKRRASRESIGQKFMPTFRRLSITTLQSNDTADKR
jgi:hypothetical protein